MSIQRGGAEHSPRLDDHREHGPDGGIGITPADVERRGNLAKWLSDARYPADAHDLLTHARAKNAPDAVLRAVRDLPDLRYQNVGQVAEALGLGVERHHQ
ncbi:hypothetical protein GCM10023194_59100 [Planotetraspora phitsanulokensis]|uniref:DUF2795 domain-containing protein n=1 Tax=Planotetraspora phitsanulokensis TaxID=575192 RepID=A0A8J3XHY4_9ACTN|nr:DUF2795 domain-containing protein [Planotetraspora phitsanulokensis]GII40371.1 hypothetical protein Pph01_53740 [Planotetraspora phitsanulokensis]